MFVTSCCCRGKLTEDENDHRPEMLKFIEDELQDLFEIKTHRIERMLTQKRLQDVPSDSDEEEEQDLQVDPTWDETTFFCVILRHKIKHKKEKKKTDLFHSQSKSR